MNTELRNVSAHTVDHRLHAIRIRKDVRVIALGDSSVFGVGDYGDNLPYVGAGWTGRLAHDIGAISYANVAKNGARARHLIKSQLSAALAMQPDLALFCIGTNDVLRGDFSPEEIYSALRKVVTELNKIDSVVVFLGLPDPMVTAPGPIYLRRILQERVAIVNQILESIASDCDAKVIHTKELKDSRNFWHVDRMHPSPLGHQVIADHVRKSLFLFKVKKKSLPTEVNSSLKFEIFWLLTNGSKWFLKRSVDLIPGLIWLIVSNKLSKKVRWRIEDYEMAGLSADRPSHY